VVAEDHHDESRIKPGLAGATLESFTQRLDRCRQWEVVASVRHRTDTQLEEPTAISSRVDDRLGRDPR
jgi:hypothetical protein